MAKKKNTCAWKLLHDLSSLSGKSRRGCQFAISRRRFGNQYESVRVNLNVSVNVNVRCRHTRASLVLTAITLVPACQPRTSQPAAVDRCTITSDAPQASISFAIPQNVLA